MVKVPITEPIKPAKKLTNNPDLVAFGSSLFSLSKLAVLTTFKRLLVVGC